MLCEKGSQDSNFVTPAPGNPQIMLASCHNSPLLAQAQILNH